VSGIGSWLQKSWLDWCLLGASPTRPTTLWIGLCDNVPNASQPISSFEAATGVYTNYARQQIVFYQAVNSLGQASNNGAVTFATANNAKTFSGWFISDVQFYQSGNLLLFGSFSPSGSQVVTSGTHPVVPTAALSISLA
jgi:hypothetical protein